LGVFKYLVCPSFADPLARKKRKQRGGNSGKNFTEGWVEFEDKADAKRVAAALNGQPMGGRRRSAHYYDLWCLKYLPKFKWDHLTEEINYQKAIKDQKLTAEVAAAKRERDFYLSRVDKAKAVDAIVERKKKREQQEQQQQQRIQHGEGSSGGDGGIQNDRSGAGQHRDTVALRVESAGEHGEMPHGPRILRTYGQRKAKADPVTDAAAPALSRGVLEMIAGKRKENEGR
jgi:ESF2/ABP1 family protein